MRTALRSLNRALPSAGLLAGLVLLAPLAASAGGSHGKSASSYGWTSDDGENRFSWGLLDPGARHNMSDTDSDHWNPTERLMREEKLPVFWFRLDGRNYVVRDAEVVALANEMAEPIRELGQKQAVLGEKQAALGAKQAALGERQAALGAKQARMSARLTRLVYAGSESEDRAQRAERREVEAAIGELGRQQGALGAEQGRLGAIQGELGAEQGELGREQGRISKVIGAELKKLAEESVRNGKAVPISKRQRSI